MKKLVLILLVSISLNSFSQSSFNRGETKLGRVDTISMFNGVGLDIYHAKIVKPISVKVTSTLSGQGDPYSKDNLLDKDKNTAWAEGEKGEGIGTEIWFEFGETYSCPSIIEFLPGYAKNMKVWVANNALKSVQVFFLDETKDEEEAIISREITFADLPLKWQYFDFSNDISFNMGVDRFKFLMIRIKQTYKGTKFNDTCISGIVFKMTGAQKAIINSKDEYHLVK